MLDILKEIIKRTPIGKVWKGIQKNKRQNYLASISSCEPIFPLYCISCNRYYKEFEPLSSYYEEMFKKYGFPFNIHHAETLNTDHYKCPGCGINDRDRLFALYLQKTIDPQKQYSLVEFAPSEQLSRFIKKFLNIQHRTADLFMQSVDDKADLMDLDIYPDNSFDIFICSHILEHVDNDVQAMGELYRILKPGGFGISMVPLFNGVDKTEEDPRIKDEAIRWKRFGQNDHIRLYARKDYINRLMSVGFTVNEYGKCFFGENTFRQNGLSDSSILYIVQK